MRKCGWLLPILVVLAGALSPHILPASSFSTLRSSSALSLIRSDLSDVTPPTVVIELPANGSTISEFHVKAYIHDDSGVDCAWWSINGVIQSWCVNGLKSKDYWVSGGYGPWPNGTTRTGLGYVFEDGTVLRYVYRYQIPPPDDGGGIAYGVFDNGTKVYPDDFPNGEFPSVTLIDGEEYCIEVWAKDIAGNIGVSRVWVTFNSSTPSEPSESHTQAVALSAGTVAVAAAFVLCAHIRGRRKTSPLRLGRGNRLS